MPLSSLLYAGDSPDDIKILKFTHPNYPIHSN